MSGMLFNYGKAYDFGYKLHPQINREMLDGHAIMCPEDAGMLAQMIALGGTGDHLEIGTAYGGSLIVAVKTMDFCGKDNKIVCIDPFGEDRRDTLHKAVEKEFWRNVEHFGIEDRFELIKEFSNPFPVEKGRRFSTAFIDGDHSYKYVFIDWLNTKEVVDRFIMFHDYSKETVRNAVIQAALDRYWIIVAIHGWSAIMKKGT